MWAESRPQEGGRTQLVRRTPAGDPVDLLGDDANVRTAVHEYGGGAWWTYGAHRGPDPVRSGTWSGPTSGSAASTRTASRSR